ncbi:TniQ family protein [Streptomyces sp. enrichment culture]|uniref:TniQ family protein n=1 Tax=Streptomyces sp. enrichment culture TaxID=1795815 RepID=UPI003F5482AE
MDLTGLLGPSRPLPMRVRLVGGESTGSFVRRLGRANGLDLASFLARVGQGQASQDPEQVEKYPQYTEMKVNAAGRTYLSVLSGLDVELLQRALPSLADDRLLPGTGPAVWQWPWEAESGHLVPWCASCGHRRQVGERVWLMSADSWRLCGRHLRWTDDSRSTDPEAVSVAALAECVTAQRDRLRLQRRFKSAGEELFADAFQVMYQWWTYAPDTLVWVHRAWTAGLEARSARAVPLVVFPEAVKLAWLMLRFEQAGRRTPQDGPGGSPGCSIRRRDGISTFPPAGTRCCSGSSATAVLPRQPCSLLQDGDGSYLRSGITGLPPVSAPCSSARACPRHEILAGTLRQEQCGAAGGAQPQAAQATGAMADN